MVGEGEGVGHGLLYGMRVGVGDLGESVVGVWVWGGLGGG